MDTFPFELEGIDLVLGISWLASLGSMWVDWKKQSMQFQFPDKWVELKGEDNRVPGQVAERVVGFQL